jgi:hypothetical protein
MTTTDGSTIRLADMIGSIARTHEDPLDRVSGAVQLADELDDVADALVGHFVDQARRTGASWSEIGRSMGVTKQAAQKRFVGRSQPSATPLDPSQGFSRFNDEARAVVVTGQDQAREAGNDVLGVAHLVLGLVSAADSTAARAVSAQGVSLADVQRVALATLPSPAASVPELIPFDAHAQDALQRAFDEAERLGADSIGSEHVLLAVLAVDRGTGVLASLGVTPEAVEAHFRVTS